MRTLQRFILPSILLTIGLATSISPVEARGSGAAKSTVNWQQRDTAVYVASTLNLLGRSRNHTVQALFQRLNITRIDVYADTQQHDLYFIDLKQLDGAIAGSLAYEMGWAKPKRIEWTAARTVPTVSASIVQAYKTDAKTLIGSFTSALTS